MYKKMIPYSYNPLQPSHVQSPNYIYHCFKIGEEKLNHIVYPLSHNSVRKYKLKSWLETENKSLLFLALMEKNINLDYKRYTEETEQKVLSNSTKDY
jgi:hypothetical protein